MTDAVLGLPARARLGGGELGAIAACLQGEALELRSDGLARAAPGGGEIHDDLCRADTGEVGERGCKNQRVPRAVSAASGPWEVPLAATPAQRLEHQ